MIGFVNGVGDGTIQVQGLVTTFTNSNNPFPATVAGNDLVVTVEPANEPDATGSVTSIVVAVGPAVPFTFLGAITNVTARAEVWVARYIPAGITQLTLTFANPTIVGVNIGEYSGVKSFGNVVTASGTTANPTISLTTQDANNWVVAGYCLEHNGVTTVTAASAGVFRESFKVIGPPGPDAMTWMIDNTSVTPASVICTGIDPDLFNWAAIAVELRAVGQLLAPQGVM